MFSSAKALRFSATFQTDRRTRATRDVATSAYAGRNTPGRGGNARYAGDISGDASIQATVVLAAVLLLLMRRSATTAATATAQQCERQDGESNPPVLFFLLLGRLFFLFCHIFGWLFGRRGLFCRGCGRRRLFAADGLRIVRAYLPQRADTALAYTRGL